MACQGDDDDDDLPDEATNVADALPAGNARRATVQPGPEGVMAPAAQDIR